jgi:hypothetical protein
MSWRRRGTELGATDLGAELGCVLRVLLESYKHKACLAQLHFNIFVFIIDLFLCSTN